MLSISELYDNQADTMQFEFLDCYHNQFLPLMARKSPKYRSEVEPPQIGCVWNVGGMFDFAHHHHHRKLLSDESRWSKSLPDFEIEKSCVDFESQTECWDLLVSNLSGAEQERSQVRMLTFDEQLRSIYIKSNKKTANVNNRSLKKEEAWKKTMEKSFWKKMKSRYENMNKKKENTNIVDKIAVDIGCQCLHLQAHQNTHVSFNDVRKRLKSLNLKIFKKMKPCGETGSKTENLLLVPYSNHQEPEVFMETRQHLAERLRLVDLDSRAGEPSGFSCNQVSRTLEGILLSSPIHESMAVLEPEGTRGEKSLQNPWSGSSALKQDEKPSPVSALDSFFSDIISSPTSTIESVELQIQLRRLDFEEHSSQTSSLSRKTGLRLFLGDRGFISSYVNEIYQISQSKWEDFLVTDYAYESSCDLKVLHDYVKEVLVGLYSRITLFGSRVKPFSLEKDVINTVIDQVDWHNGQPEGPRTLDQLVRRDMAKCGPWLDTLSDRNDIVVEAADEILQELVIEASLDICF